MVIFSVTITLSEKGGKNGWRREIVLGGKCRYLSLQRSNQRRVRKFCGKAQFSHSFGRFSPKLCGNCLSTKFLQKEIR